jgi:hypothetical protein
MKVTNKHNLPQPFVDLVSFDDYTGHGSDYTTTGLLRPPRIVALSRKNWDTMEEDAVDMVWRMSGQTKHVVLERIAKQDPIRYKAEVRLHMTVTVDGKDFSISGQIDLFDAETSTLYDWKETSVWKIVMGDRAEWTAQGNINLYLARKHDYEIDRLENIAFLKDWKMRDASQKDDYPQAAIQVCPLPIWPEAKTVSFIEERIRLHEAAKEKLPLCSDEDRWAKPEKWALMKKGQKRAVKLYDELEPARDAMFFAAHDGHMSLQEAKAINPETMKLGRYHVEHRLGESTRCLYYCSVAPFCSQFREIMQDQYAK